MRKDTGERLAVEQLGAQDGDALEVERLVASAPFENLPVGYHAARLRLNPRWIEPGGLKQMRGGDGLRGLDLLVCHPQIARPPWRLLLTALSAMALLVAVSSSVHAEGSLLRYRTPVGAVYRIPLSDGSVIQLNTATELTTHITGLGLRVQLLEGEALFTVARVNRPFDVEVETRSIRTIGAAVFDVRRLPGKEVKVIVTSGRVMIRTNAHSGKLPVGATSSVTAVAQAGETAEIGPQAIRVLALGAATEDAVAWTHGWLRFEQLILSEAIAEVNRYRRRQLVLCDPNLAELEIGGSFKSADLKSFVGALRQFGIDVDTSDPSVLRLSRAL